MNTRPHWTSADIRDVLPVDISVTQTAGLTDLYIDINEPHWLRIRLTAEQAAALHRALAHRQERP